LEINLSETSSALPLVLVTHTLPDRWLDSLSGCCELIVGPEEANGLSPELEINLDRAEGLLSLLTIEIGVDLLSRAPRLRVVSNMAVGVDNIDVNACTRRGIPVGHTPGVLTDGTADLTMALLLAAARRLLEANSDARRGLWTTWSPTGWLGGDLKDATLGIVGLGQIGTAVAERAKGFGMKIVFSDPKPQKRACERFDAEQLSFEDLLERSDFVSLNIPLTDETKGLINITNLRKMKPSAILVNTARGPIVDSQALLMALQEGWIAGAALDVTDPEPLPPDHPLFSLPNCLIVPHIGSATRNTRRRMAERACENLLAGLEGRRLPSCVNPEVYQE
jgi:glyoxylate reductase